jgi:hypothetical protein
VKFQSNQDIAGSPRNSFRASLVVEPRGRALNGIEGEILSIPTKLRILGILYNRSQTVGAKLHESKGKQPRSSFKVPKS